ncbi:MAG: cation:proton antiporter [Dehalococcoidia bacterium]|nr:cation:proton antiporter [Dehalococcoidia bacterium]
MPHHTELIGTIAAGLTVAFILGALAWRLRLPLIVGYLAAGIMVGPFTPGYVADQGVATQLAEIGVILLMFGVGLHFSIGDLLSVRRLALPGAIGQVLFATLLGVALSRLWGWGLAEGIVLGLALSVASTVVLLRALNGSNELETPQGRVAVGWLVVEDLITVLALVLLPALAGFVGTSQATSATGWELAWDVTVTLAKVGAFIVLMLVAGTRAVPWVLARVATTGSRELFILAVLAISLGVSFIAAELFDVSFALGAFLAGLVVNASPLSHRAGEEALPLREAFSVLFFVSVGMLIDPQILWERAAELGGVLAIVLVAKAAVAIALVRALGGDLSIGLTVAAGLSQVGEFSFILVEGAFALGIFPDTGRDLVLGAALVSITLNPLLFALARRVRGRVTTQAAVPARPVPLGADH